MEGTARSGTDCECDKGQGRGEFVLRITLQVTTVYPPSPSSPSVTRDIVTSKDKGIILICIDLLSQLIYHDLGDRDNK